MEEVKGLTLEARKEKLIQRIRNMDESGISQWESTLEAMILGKPSSLESYNNELDEAVARSRAGEGLSHQEAVDRIKSWRE